jgi:S-layer family protein
VTQRVIGAAAIFGLVVSLLLAPLVPPPVVAVVSTPFTDIGTSPFKADIEWLYGQGITTGCTATLYCPKDPVTREQMASFLARMFSLPSTLTDYFTDDNTSIHQANINKVAAAGITTGCTSSTLFCPKALVTRGQMASFLVRADHLTVGAGRNYFNDDNTNIHEANIDRAAAAGIASGCGTWHYCPSGSVTREQMAAFLHRVIAPVAPPPYPAPAPPPPLFTFGSGTWVVGSGVPAGTYRSPGGGSCYWERLSGFGGTFGEIIANDFGSIKIVVEIKSSDAGFSTDQCGTWTNNLSAITSSLTAPFGAGTYIVGTDIGAGTWSAPGGASCYWERVSGFGGQVSDIIANDFAPTSPVVAISAGDAGFRSSDCGTWTKIG